MLAACFHTFCGTQNENQQQTSVLWVTTQSSPITSRKPGAAKSNMEKECLVFCVQLVIWWPVWHMLNTLTHTQRTLQRPDSPFPPTAHRHVLTLKDKPNRTGELVWQFVRSNTKQFTVFVFFHLQLFKEFLAGWNLSHTEIAVASGGDKFCLFGFCCRALGIYCNTQRFAFPPSMTCEIKKNRRKNKNKLCWLFFSSFFSHSWRHIASRCPTKQLERISDGAAEGEAEIHFCIVLCCESQHDLLTEEEAYIRAQNLSHPLRIAQACMEIGEMMIKKSRLQYLSHLNTGICKLLDVQGAIKNPKIYHIDSWIPKHSSNAQRISHVLKKTSIKMWYHQTKQRCHFLFKLLFIFFFFTCFILLLAPNTECVSRLLHCLMPGKSDLKGRLGVWVCLKEVQTASSASLYTATTVNAGKKQKQVNRYGHQA